MTAGRILHEVLAAWGLPAPRCLDLVEEAFFGFFQQTHAVYPETIFALEALQRQGVKVGVLTDVPYGMPARFVARDLLPLASFVEVTLTSAGVGFRKPHPFGYAMLAEQLEVEPCDMIYVGNEEKDVAGANAAGLFSVLIDRQGLSPDFGQKRTITSLRELTKETQKSD